jgi:hypothetical protein
MAARKSRAEMKAAAIAARPPKPGGLSQGVWKMGLGLFAEVVGDLEEAFESEGLLDDFQGWDFADLF